MSLTCRREFARRHDPRRRARFGTISIRNGGEAEHRLRPDGQPRLRRVGLLRRRHPPRRADASHRQARCGGHAPSQLQRRGPVHPEPVGHHDRPLLHPLRHAFGPDRRRDRGARRSGKSPSPRPLSGSGLRHRPLRQVAPRQRRGPACRTTRGSTSGTASREPPTRPSGPRSLRPRPQASRSSTSWRAAKARRAANSQVYDLDAAPADRRGDHPAHDRLHEAQRRRRQAVLCLRAVHAGPLPDAAEPEVRGQDRLRRLPGRAGRNGRACR